VRRPRDPRSADPDPVGGRSEPGGAGLRGLLARLPDAVVTVVGDFVADEYVYGETERVSREAPVLIVRYETSELKAGCAGNAALNLAALGLQVRAVGVVGDDALGAALSDVLARGGVDVTGLLRVRGRPTEAKTRVLAGGRSTRRQQMLRIDRACPEALPSRVERALVQELGRAARRSGAILASDYGSGAVGPKVKDALRVLRRDGLPVCADSRYALPTFHGLTMVKPNEVELEAASGRAVAGAGGLERAARALLRKVRCEMLLVTRGRNGMSLFRAGRAPVHVPAHGSLDAVDVTGAGDTVAATFSAGLAAGGDPVDAARLANVAGALVVLKPGTAVVTRDELAAELRRP
jgi:rfaE bifunctional protein kinase chain/domain